MKVLLLCCLLVAGALAFPQDEAVEGRRYRDRESEMSNSIDEDYEVQKPSSSYPGMSIPQNIYKEVMSMKPEQMMSMNSLMRAIIKPIISSMEFQFLVDFVAETLRIFKEDQQIKAMVRQGVDTIQELYEESDGRLAKQLFTWMVSQYSDEQTARSISSLMSDISPTLQSWLVEPMKIYYRSYISPTFASIASTVNNMLGEDIATNEIARSGRWSTMVDIYINRLVDMTSEARDIMVETAQFIKEHEI